jgi:hypothetical protein
MVVPNCNSYDVFSCEWNLKWPTWKPDNVFFVKSIIRKHQQPFATFKDQNVLREPRGIALDRNRNVYVAGYEANNVVVLSPDGNNCRQILTKCEGLDKPYSLRINIDRSDFYLRQFPLVLVRRFGLWRSISVVLLMHTVNRIGNTVRTVNGIIT